MSSPAQPLVLVIDDRDDMIRFCERQLGERYAFRLVRGARDADALLRRGDVAAVLLDRDFTHAEPRTLLGPPEDRRNEGVHILRWLRREHARVPVLMVTGVRELQVALAAADLGADFLAWEDVTADPDVLHARLQRVLDSGDDRRDEILARFRAEGVVAESPAFARALESLYRALPGRAPILLLGETGTGKDSLAYALHALGGDRTRPYVAVNVASLNPNLIESELFGHARGAFTGADRANLGKIRYAHGGTLFLNEVGDLSLEVQAKLLTVLERNEVVPVGEVRAQAAEFRLVTATSRDLAMLVERGLFRRDLFHRIAWHTIEIPPLRERREDVPALVSAFLRGTPAFRDGVVFGVAREAMEYLASLPWEGNIRELRGVVEAACAGARHVVTVADVREIVRRHESVLAASSAPAAPGAAVPAPALGGTLGRAAHEDVVFGETTYRDLTAAYFRWLVRTSGGRLPDVARRAGISRATVYEWRDRFAEGREAGGEPEA